MASGGLVRTTSKRTVPPGAQTESADDRFQRLISYLGMKSHLRTAAEVDFIVNATQNVKFFKVPGSPKPSHAQQAVVATHPILECHVCKPGHCRCCPRIYARKSVVR